MLDTLSTGGLHGRSLAGAVAQLGERRVRNAEVRGSTPLGSTSARPSRNSRMARPTDAHTPNANGRQPMGSYRPPPVRVPPATQNLQPAYPGMSKASASVRL